MVRAHAQYYNRGIRMWEGSKQDSRPVVAYPDLVGLTSRLKSRLGLGIADGSIDSVQHAPWELACLTRAYEFGGV